MPGFAEESIGKTWGVSKSVQIKLPSFVNKIVLSLYRSVYVRIALSTLLVFSVGSWGMLQELESIRRSVGRSQIAETRSHAIRTVDQLQQEMQQSESIDLKAAANARWLHDRWRFIHRMEPMRALRAIVDTTGTIVAHSNYRIIGQKLEPLAPPIRFPEFGDDVVLTQDSVYTGDLQVFDILIPISKSNTVVGTYHVGLPSNWLNNLIAKEQSSSRRAWTTVIIYTMAIVVLTGVVLHLQARRASFLESELNKAEERRLRELSMLMVGMAHEIRNPLNSIRLNLHTSERVFRGESPLGEHEVTDMLSESVREVERVDILIGQLLGYARIEDDGDVSANVTGEVQSAIQFIKKTLDLRAITVDFQNNSPSEVVLMGSHRLRQILLNLMNNAVEAMPDGGRMKVTFETIDHRARLVIADSGKGVDERIRPRLFEPFVTTREMGTGMGLAIVRSMLESVGGAIQYQTSSSLGGAEFSLTFPIDRIHRRAKNVQ